MNLIIKNSSIFMAITDRNAVGEQRSFATLRFRGIAAVG